MPLQTVRKWPVIALAAIMLVVAVLRLWHLPDYPLHDDELISLQVIESIAETGIPLVGERIYWRSLVGQYLMAIPSLFTATDLSTVRLVPVILSVFVLLYVYRIGNQLSGRIAGILAAAFVGFSAFENLFAAFGRFYMPFQLFFVAVVWYAHQYLIAGKRGSGWPLFWFGFAAIGTHKFGVFVWLIFVLAICLGRSWHKLRHVKIWIGLAVLMVFTYFASFWSPQVAGKNTMLALSIGYLKDDLAFVELFRRWIPLGCSFWVLGLVPMIREKVGWLYFYLGFLLGMISISLLAPADNPRYVLHLFPLAVVLAIASMVWWTNQCVEYIQGLKKNGASLEKIAKGLLFTVLLVSLTWFDNTSLREAFGYHLTFANQKPAHDFLARQLLADDIVISVDAPMSSYYLKHNNVRFLREKLNIHTGEYRPYEASVKRANEAYYIDSPHKLLSLLKSTKVNVWLYANNKVRWAVSTETDRLIRDQFDLVFKYEETWVLVHRPHQNM
jgi:hypothetical protein